MLTKDQFLASVEHETKIIKHLVGKVLPGTQSFRFTPPQRSTLELLRYLTTCAIVPAKYMLTGNWDHADALDEAADKVTFDEIVPAMDRQYTAVKDLLASISDGDFLQRDSKMPWGAPVKLGEGLMNTVIKTLAAYRMQLFLQIKASGNATVGPANCWVGVDARPQPAAP